MPPIRCTGLRREVASTTAERGLFLTQPCRSRQVFYGSRRWVGGANHCPMSEVSQCSSERADCVLVPIRTFLAARQ